MLLNAAEKDWLSAKSANDANSCGCADGDKCECPACECPACECPPAVVGTPAPAAALPVPWTDSNGCTWTALYRDAAGQVVYSRTCPARR